MKFLRVSNFLQTLGSKYFELNHSPLFRNPVGHSDPFDSSRYNPDDIGSGSGFLDRDRDEAVSSPPAAAVPLLHVRAVL